MSSADPLPSLAAEAANKLRVERNDQGVEIEQADTGLRFLHSFVSGPIAHRASQSAQLLLKACNNKQRNVHGILDLTAGWGVDAFILARHGHAVTLLEQDRLVHAIVTHSLQCLERDPQQSAIAASMILHQDEATRYLRSLETDHEFDCIYLDPMFAAHKSSAKPAKEMQILQSLTSNSNMEDCLTLALSLAHKRVVVKRAAKAPALDNRPPDLVQRAKTIRFDIYLTA